MPNHVYHYISFSSLDDKQLDILNKIVANPNGICGHYVPMSDDIRNTTSPTNIVSESEYERIMEENKKIDRSQPFFYEPKPITKAMQDCFLQVYGHDNWYDWASERWGTKWGCYDNELDGNTLKCTTAWSPMRLEIIELFALDFPNFTWHWEEEQGYGMTVVYEDGLIVDQDSYDSIPFETIGQYKEYEWISFVVYTTGRPESMSTEIILPGFYKDYDFNEDAYLGETLPDDILNQLDEESRKKVLEIVSKFN